MTSREKEKLRGLLEAALFYVPNAGLRADISAALSQRAEPAPTNQCEGCQAGFPVDEKGYHRMGRSGIYADIMRCEKSRYVSEPECRCTMRQRLVGDGCSVCNPEYAADHCEFHDSDQAACQQYSGQVPCEPAPAQTVPVAQALRKMMTELEEIALIQPDCSKTELILKAVEALATRPAQAEQQPEMSGLLEALERVKLTEKEARHHSVSAVAYWNNAVTACIAALSAQGESHG